MHSTNDALDQQGLAGSSTTPASLDVVIPTFNRSHLLRKTLESFLRARRPAGMQIHIFVVNNNSKDDTAEIVEQVAATASLPIRHVLEVKQGSSQSRNAGIAAGTGDLIGFVDDDEEVREDWFEVIAREFADPTTEFIGGPYLANWVSPQPDWLPPGYHAAIGAIPPKPRAVFGTETDANLMGGNAVIRRSVFERVGTYSTKLGRSATGLLSDEDAEFLRRVMAQHIRGVYVPDLVIYHYIDPKRLTRRYHRRWAYWRAVSLGVQDREHRESVAYIFGVPRYRIGKALRSLLSVPLTRSKGRRFAHELGLWDLLGFLHGRFFFNPEKHYG